MLHRPAVHDRTRMQVGVPAARDRDRAELRFGGAELEHVAAHDRGEVHGLREPAERHLQVLLQRLRGVDLTGSAGHRAALGRPRDGEHVQDVARLAVADRARGEVRRGRGPRHPATPRRGPHLVAGAEMLAEHVDIEVREGPRPGQTVDVGRLEPGVGDRPFGGLDADLARGAARRLRVLGLADADDGDLAAHVLEVGSVSPVRHATEASAPPI